MNYKIKEVSDISGVSIRMLRHYDKVGLLKPGERAENGYRIYTNGDLERLQRILFLRELDFSIEETGEILDGTEENVVDALIAQEELLKLKIGRLLAIKKVIKNEINERKRGNYTMGNEKFKEFDMSGIQENKKKYADEVREKYGNTKAYSQSMARTGKYSHNDWKRIGEEAASIYKELADLMDRQPDDEAVICVIKKWRNHINSNFYDCTDEIFSGLADLYVSDPRFTANIDKYGEGLAAFMSKAMKAGLKSYK